MEYRQHLSDDTSEVDEDGFVLDGDIDDEDDDEDGYVNENDLPQNGDRMRDEGNVGSDIDSEDDVIFDDDGGGDDIGLDVPNEPQINNDENQDFDDSDDSDGEDEEEEEEINENLFGLNNLINQANVVIPNFVEENSESSEDSDGDDDGDDDNPNNPTLHFSNKVAYSSQIIEERDFFFMISDYYNQLHTLPDPEEVQLFDDLMNDNELLEILFDFKMKHSCSDNGIDDVLLLLKHISKEEKLRLQLKSYMKKYKKFHHCRIKICEGIHAPTGSFHVFTNEHHRCACANPIISYINNFPLISKLRIILRKPQYADQLKVNYREEVPQDNVNHIRQSQVFRDWYDGDRSKVKILESRNFFNNHNDIQCALFFAVQADGVSVHNHSTNDEHKENFLSLVTCLNFPKRIRAVLALLTLCTQSLCMKRNGDCCLLPLLYEIEYFQTHGARVTVNRSTGPLNLAFGFVQTTFLSDLDLLRIVSSIVASFGYYGCHRCLTRGVRIQNQNTTSWHLLGQTRTQFLRGDPGRLERTSVYERATIRWFSKILDIIFDFMHCFYCDGFLSLIVLSMFNRGIVNVDYLTDTSRLHKTREFGRKINSENLRKAHQNNNRLKFLHAKQLSDVVEGRIANVDNFLSAAHKIDLIMSKSQLTREEIVAVREMLRGLLTHLVPVNPKSHRIPHICDDLLNHGIMKNFIMYLIENFNATFCRFFYIKDYERSNIILFMNLFGISTYQRSLRDRLGIDPRGHKFHDGERMIIGNNLGNVSRGLFSANQKRHAFDILRQSVPAFFRQYFGPNYDPRVVYVNNILFFTQLKISEVAKPVYYIDCVGYCNAKVTRSGEPAGKERHEYGLQTNRDNTTPQHCSFNYYIAHIFIGLVRDKTIRNHTQHGVLYPMAHRLQCLPNFDRDDRLVLQDIPNNNPNPVVLPLSEIVKKFSFYKENNRFYPCADI